MDDIFTRIKEKIVLPDGRISPKAAQLLYANYKHLHDALFEATNFLDDTASISHRMHCLEHNITSHPTCTVCGAITKFQPSKKQYSSFCSIKCATRSEQTIDKRKRTNVEKYGNSVPANGLESTKETMLRKYGVEKPLQAAEFKQKRKNTLIQKYGTDNTNHITETLEKRKRTSIKRYGTEHTSQRLITHALDYLNDREWLTTQHVTHKKSCVAIANELNVGVTTVTNAINKFQLLQSTNRSSYEHQLSDFLRSNNIQHTTNDRTIIAPKELDIYCEQHSIAIEICGHYWHSELNGRDKYYHLNKTLLCSEKQIRLIQIFEHEWVHKPEVTKQRLLHIFKKAGPKIHGRMCSVKPITAAEAKRFIDNTHIQGYAPASVRLGLFHEETLIGCATFGKARYSRDQWELIRLCFSRQVSGGSGKLFSFFVKHYAPHTIISYSDRRWNTGNVYKQLGFAHKGASRPGYFYFHVNKPLLLHSRISFQKHKLHKLLETYDENLPEWENMKRNSYDRIWDCGNDVWVWTNSTD